MNLSEKRRIFKTFKRSKITYSSSLSTTEDRVEWPDISLSNAAIKFLYNDYLSIRNADSLDGDFMMYIPSNLKTFCCNESCRSIVCNVMKKYINRRFGDDYSKIVEDHCEQICKFISSLVNLRLTTQAEHKALKHIPKENWFDLTAEESGIKNFGFILILRFLAKSTSIMNGTRMRTQSGKYLSEYFHAISNHIDSMFKANGIDPEDC